MNEGRSLHSATLLKDGRILVAGGSNRYGNMESSEILDPATGIWVTSGSMVAARSNHTATLLQDGRVLVVGGGASIVEAFDPNIGKWQSSVPK